MIVTYLDTLRTLEWCLGLDDTGNLETQQLVDLPYIGEYASLLAIYRHLRDHPDQPYRGRVIPDEELERLTTYTEVRGEGTFNDSTL